MEDQQQAPPRGKTGLIIGSAGVLAVAVVALVIVLVTSGDDGSARTGGTGTATTLPERPGTDFEQVVFDYVVAVRDNDRAAARRLTCASYRSQVRLAPLGLRSPGGSTVNKIDGFEMLGANVIGTSDELVKAYVGVRLQDGGSALQWVFLIQPDDDVRGEPRVCGQRVLEETDTLPRPT